MPFKIFLQKRRSVIFPLIFVAMIIAQKGVPESLEPSPGYAPDSERSKNKNNKYNNNNKNRPASLVFVLTIPRYVPLNLFCYAANRIRLITTNDDIGGGRVEVYHDNQWGTICDNNWGLKEAMVVCKELGYKTALYPGKNANFGQGSGPVITGFFNLFLIS